LVHVDWDADSEFVDRVGDDTHFFPRHILNLMLKAGFLKLTQMAILRLLILIGFSLCTWLIYMLLRTVAAGEFALPVVSCLIAECAPVPTCWILGRILASIGLLASLAALLIILGSLLADFFNRDGLIFSICFFLIPVVLPAVLLYRYAFSLWWGVLLFPIGLVVGQLLYGRLNAPSE
jgi:hypothetical protein